LQLRAESARFQQGCLSIRAINISNKRSYEGKLIKIYHGSGSRIEPRANFSTVVYCMQIETKPKGNKVIKNMAGWSKHAIRGSDEPEGKTFE